MTKTLYLIFIITITTTARAQFTKLNGPYGNNIYTLATVDNSKLYCNTYGSDPYSSIDSGKTWQQSLPTIFRGFCSNMVTGAGKMVITTSNITPHPFPFYISTDSGSTFNVVPPPYADSLVQLNGGIGVALYSSGMYAYGIGGLYHSTDDGQTWTSKNMNIPDSSAFSSVIAYGNNLLAVNYGDLYLSVNNGSWLPLVLDSSITPNYVRQIAESNGTLYAVTDNGLYRSYDNGTSWNIILNNFTGTTFTRISIVDEKLFGISTDELWVTDTAAINWNYTAFTPAGTNREISNILRLGSNYIVSTARGIFVGDTSLVSAAVESNDGINPYFPEGLFADGQTIHVGAPHGYSISNDGGTTWTKADEPFAVYNNIKKFGNDIFICSNASLFSSTIGASTTNYVSTMPANDVTKTDNGDLYASNQYYLPGVYRSLDNGVTYTDVSAGLADTRISSITSIGNNIVAGNGNDGIYLSTDSGTTWTQTFSGNPVTAIVKHNNLIFAEADGFDLMMSADSGQTWQQTFSLQGGGINFLLSNGNVLIEMQIQSLGSGAADLSFDNGQTFIDISSFFNSFQSGQISSASLTADDLYIATTYDGVWKIPVPVLLNAFNADNNNQQLQVFPNPSAGYISINLPDAEDYSIQLFDIAGKLISTHVTEKQKSISINISEFENGVYVMKAQSSQKTFTQKILVQHNF